MKKSITEENAALAAEVESLKGKLATTEQQLAGATKLTDELTAALAGRDTEIASLQAAAQAAATERDVLATKLSETEQRAANRAAAVIASTGGPAVTVQVAVSETEQDYETLWETNAKLPTAQERRAHYLKNEKIMAAFHRPATRK